MLQIIFLVSLEISQGAGGDGLGSIMLGLAVQKIVNIK
jgi:hypothetical protein